MKNGDRYIFNETQESREKLRLKLIERYHDPRTRRHLLSTGIHAGWKCLEIGPGAGSIMRWMGKIVGPKGKVVALDINPRFVQRTKANNIQIVKGDIATTPLPASTFHIAHARFVLIHTPAYQKAISHIIKSLRPGGWLVLEEPDFSAARVVVGPSRIGQSVERVNRAIMQMFEKARLNPAFGLELPTLLQTPSLSQLTVENEVPITQGGSSLATIMTASANQLQDEYLATGLVTKPDLRRYAQFAGNPKSWAIYHGTIVVKVQKKKSSIPAS